jgi:hypothetical protein
MKTAACVVPAAPLRKSASHKVEMVNQLLFGEKVVVLKEKRNWWKVQTVPDNYEGWIRNNAIIRTEDSLVGSGDEFITGDLFNIVMVNGMKMNISAGCTLPGLNKEEGKIGGMPYVYRGHVIKRNDMKPNGEIVRTLASQWLNAPYLWGGRTPLGVDCSGFAQVIFKMMGVDLLRDARQQVRQGIKVKKLGEAKTGDLAFFEKKGKITHVGILLTSTEIIHASGKVRIDAIDEKGIINHDIGKRTHLLAAITRYW